MKKENRIAVIGLGFVGLPLSLHFTNKGYTVYGFDVDSIKIQKLNNGTSYITDVKDFEVQNAINTHKFKAFLPSEKIKEVSYIVVTVPTPFNNELMEPDISALKQASEFIAAHLVPGQTIIFESSTFPGTLEEVILPIILKSGLKVGKDFYLGYSPERIDPGNKNFTIEQIPKIVSGLTEACKQNVISFYTNVFNKIIPVTSLKIAETTKLLENTQRLVNISLVNELNIICKKMGIDFQEVIYAASTKPFGFTPYFPGPGIGGHCIPVDPLYFQWKAAQYGLTSKLIQAAHIINHNMPKEITQMIKEKLTSLTSDKKSVLLVGLTYKKDVEDIRESPAISIFKLLLEEKIDVSYHDPLVAQIIINDNIYTSTPISVKNIKKYDIVVILTDHSTINWDLIKEHSSCIIDTRGVLHILNEGDMA